jgi:hypothetical protein
MPLIMRISGGIGVGAENEAPIPSTDPVPEQGPIARWVVVDIVTVLCTSYDYTLISTMKLNYFSVLFIILIAGFTCVAYYKGHSRCSPSADRDVQGSGDDERAPSFSVPLSGRESRGV